MERHYIYVVDIGFGWEVREDGATPIEPLIYKTSQEAIDGATRFARHRWQSSGTLTGVRVATTLGGWRDERTFGQLPNPLPGDELSHAGSP